jgi:hypothetical protein
MIAVCIYQRNRGLGKCVGPVSKVKAASKQTIAWRGLHDLQERLKPAGEEPGVCTAHETRAGENGYLLDVGTPAPQGGTTSATGGTTRARRSPGAAASTKRPPHPKAGDP